MPRVKLLLFAVHIRHNQSQHFLHVLDAHQVWCGLGLFEEVNQAHKRPLLVLQNDFSQC